MYGATDILIRRAFCCVRTLLPACTMRGGFVGCEVRARISHREEGRRNKYPESGMGSAPSGIRESHAAPGGLLAAFAIRRSLPVFVAVLWDVVFACRERGSYSLFQFRVWNPKRVPAKRCPGTSSGMRMWYMFSVRGFCFRNFEFVCGQGNSERTPGIGLRGQFPGQVPGTDIRNKYPEQVFGTSVRDKCP